mgnify:CR=1 FL=1
MREPTELGGKLVGKVKGLGKRLQGYRGVFRRLAEDHGELSTLVLRLQAATGEAPARRELFPLIRRQIQAHLRAEQQELHAPLRRFRQARLLLGQQVEEQRRVEGLLEQLAVTDHSTPAWSRWFEDLARLWGEHVENEEEQLFPLARDLLPPDELDLMAERFLRTREGFLHQLP